MADGHRVVKQQRAHRRRDPLILRHHVPDPAERLRVQDALGRGKVGHRDVAQRGDAKLARRALAGGAAGGVAARRVGVTLAGVDQHQ